MVQNLFSEGLQVKISGESKNAVSAIDSVIGGLGGIKKIAPLAGAALAGALAVKGVNAAREFNDAMNESLAIMGDVSNAMRKDMSKAAREVATQTRFSAKEAAESYFFLASAGLDAKESIEAIPQVAQFAQAGMFDMATATDLLTDAQSALGKTMEDPQRNMEEMAKLSDVLVKANTLANASVEQFSEALTNKAAPAMRTNNVATEEGVAVLAAFADAGLKGRRAGTILARTIQGLQKRARENQEAFEEFGIRVFDANGEMRSFADISADMTDAFGDMTTEQKSAAFEQLGFNRRTRRGVNLLLRQEDQLRNYKDELSEAGGTTEEVADKQMQSFNAQLDILFSELNDLAISIGNALLPSLEKMVGGLIGVTRALQDAGAAVGDFLDELEKLSDEDPTAGITEGGVSNWQEYEDAAESAKDATKDVDKAIKDAGVSASDVMGDIDKLSETYGDLEKAASGEEGEGGAAGGIDKTTRAIEDFVKVVGANAGVFKIAKLGEKRQDIAGTELAGSEVRSALQGIGARFRQTGGGGRGFTPKPPTTKVEVDTDVAVEVGVDERGLLRVVDRKVEELERRTDRLNAQR